MRLIDADALKEEFEKNTDRRGYIIGDPDDIIDNAPTVLHDNYSMGYQDGVRKVISERPTREWNNHQVACLLAELFNDTCACNYCGIDEWLPQKCDFAGKECPDVVGVACWEQFLKHREQEDQK